RPLKRRAVRLFQTADLALSAAEVVLEAEEAAPGISVISIEVVGVDDFRLDEEVVDQVIVEANHCREVLEVVIANFEVERGLFVEVPGATEPQGPVTHPLAIV